LAPAVKVDDSFPTTSGEVLRGLLHAGLQHLDRVCADGIQLRMEVHPQHAIAHVDQARAGIPFDAARLVGSGGHDRGRTLRRLQTDRLDQFERSEVPAESPPHHAIDVGRRIRDVRRHARGVEQRRTQRVAQELTHAIVAVIQGANALPDVGDRLGRVQRRETSGCPRPVLERARVEYQNLGFTVRGCHALVEALSSLLAELPAREHLLDERR